MRLKCFGVVISWWVVIVLGNFKVFWFSFGKIEVDWVNFVFFWFNIFVFFFIMMYLNIV